MINETMTWIFIAYAVGTAFGFYIGYKKGAFVTAENCIDALIRQGMLKTSTGLNGEVEIHKLNEE
jgi:hypothetical protein